MGWKPLVFLIALSLLAAVVGTFLEDEEEQYERHQGHIKLSQSPRIEVVTEIHRFAGQNTPKRFGSA